MKSSKEERVHSAWAPCHITGIFFPCGGGNPLNTGSLGAGVNLKRGVTTEVKVSPAETLQIKILINGRETEAPLSSSIVDKMIRFRENSNFKIDINHIVEMPMGAGFGTSGSGALGLSLALKRALQIDITEKECYRIAHETEIEEKTGLGTVMGEIAGGVEMRIECGGPGIGKTENIFFDPRTKVIILFMGRYSTKEALNDTYLMDKIIKSGREAMEELIKSPSVENFMELSRWFVRNIEIMDEKTENIINMMERKGILCSMPLFGRGVFCMDRRVELVKGLLEDYGDVIVSSISKGGPE